MQSVTVSCEPHESLVAYLLEISDAKQLKVKRFFSGYYKFLDQISRVTSSHIVMTLGNRTVDNVKIDLAELALQYLKGKGFSQTESSKREIVSKRTPKRVSSVRNQPVPSMNEEFVIVLKKDGAS